MNDYVFSWAEDATDQMVHVDTVPNGLACGCHCPRCKEPLLARHGKVLARGFAHHSEDRAANLEICYQVILYKLAEHIIKKLQHIHAPSYYGIYQEQDIYFADVKIDGQYEREDKPAIQALVEDVAELYLRTAGDGDKMEPYGAIAEEGNKYQEEMSRKEKSPYCGGITIKRIGEDYVEVESEEMKS